MTIVLQCQFSFNNIIEGRQRINNSVYDTYEGIFYGGRLILL